MSMKLAPKTVAFWEAQRTIRNLDMEQVDETVLSKLRRRVGNDPYVLKNAVQNFLNESWERSKVQTAHCELAEEGYQVTSLRHDGLRVAGDKRPAAEWIADVTELLQKIGPFHHEPDLTGQGTNHLGVNESPKLLSPF
jgi:hypothetical protein